MSQSTQALIQRRHAQSGAQSRTWIGKDHQQIISKTHHRKGETSLVGNTGVFSVTKGVIPIGLSFI
ncbi:hypothetical protein N7455_003241 [Penicillium solitum]|uniref:uncharacterized protein n=1 Tax=Penicillium solitum TaxID=60172 RepID=UPI0032C47736|nr:hypothetical protein N7536_004268 [Penicillium majusculum]KAJ5879776.1 hypothetical protein N7455_003241 [Penicillium solitum]